MRISTTFLCMTILAACHYDSSLGATGEEGGLCLPGDTCKDDLICLGKVCVKPMVDDIDAGVSPGSLPPNTFRQVIGAAPRDLDLLFVMDNSGSMREEQEALASSFNEFVAILGDLPDGLPNLHLGVVSTDMGAGPFGVTGCSEEGDKGSLQSVPRQADCLAPGPEPFIRDVAGAESSLRLRNYTGGLAETFGCIAQLGISGCGFEQTFESMRRALDGSNPINTGFLREDAVLGIVIVTDEDDCSAEDISMFDSSPALDNVSSSLGFLGSYRCFEFGVTCDETLPDPVDDRLAVGPRSNCVPRDPSPFMFGVREYADFLRDLKPAGRLMVSGIAGVGEVATALENTDEPTLQAACISANGEADPAVRVDALLGDLAMPPMGSICSNLLSDELTTVAGNLYSLMSGTCLVTNSSDCVYADVENFGLDTEAVIQILPPCANSIQGACHSVTEASLSCTHGSRAAVSIERRGTAVPAGTVVVAACPRS